MRMCKDLVEGLICRGTITAHQLHLRTPPYRIRGQTPSDE
jgi:hypothetical protein